jgi:hypothetical protein
VKLIEGILLGIVVLSTSQVVIAKADDDAATEIRLLKAKLKKLELRIDAQIQKAAETREKLAAVTPPSAYKVPASVFDPCPAGKVCFKGVTLTPGGWIDLAGIYRTRNLASDTGSVYAFIPFRQAKNFNAQEARFSARQTRFSLLAEGDAGANTHLAGYGEIDFEGAAQTASSVATNSFNPRMRQASVEIDRTDLGLHFLAGQTWSLNAPSRVASIPGA